MKKWLIVFEYLLNLIKDEKVKSGMLLPSEWFLTNKFKFSSQPVRTALRKLVELNLVVPIHGKGYMVCDKRQNNVLFSFNEIWPHATSEYQYLGIIALDEKLQKKTRFLYEPKVHKVVVKRYLDNELFIYQISFISAVLIDKIDETTISDIGLLKYMKQNSASKINYAIKDIKIVENNLVSVFPNNDFLVIDRGSLYSFNQSLVEYRESYYIPEKFKWSFVEYYLEL